MPKIELKKYLEWLEKRNLSPKTITMYSWSLRQWNQKEMNTENIINFFKEKLTKYSPRSLNLCRTALFSYAKFQKIEIEWELIARLIPTTQQKFFSTIDENELKILKQAQSKGRPTINQRNNLILDFLFYTGIRVNELINLRHCDYQKESQQLWVKKGKGNKDRYILIPEFLEKYFNGNSDWLFKTYRNWKISKMEVWAMISRKTKKVGLTKHISPHTFRRSFATLANERKVKLTTIQKQLGHSNINTTTNYIHNSYE
ncbi:MAG: tyrosine-type recombinase/integrase, partial [Candidatus Moeniiplasma glomeromycotorum]|nr:tyrosine-type recombinase/integrase [Candidatus Moeniiplasma glomeromycotorum]MCE8169766.1 tyrosine-type recombinase/integrase [Candidatus Moeniiplasma glomeromycotorum]